jgi:NitT/TauT family transport system substrate-binding protein
VKADITMHFAGPVILQIEAGDPIVVLAGAHVGCFELFGNDRVQAIRDLKGKTVAIPELGAPGHVFLATMLAQVGLDPRTDVTWATHEPADAMQLLADGRVDAYLGFPPDPQEMRARRIGHVVVNSMVDRPWSQYFCCMVVANREFVTRHPIATTRALRAILNGIDLSAHDPEGAVRFLVDQGYTTQYAYTLQAVTTIHAGGWRADHDAEDTLRYYALRLYEAGMIRSSPDKIIARGTDWRFLAEVRRDRTATASSAFCPIPRGVAALPSSQV